MNRVFRDALGPRLFAKGSVLSIGAFDGVHLGHAALIERTVAHSRASGLTSCLLSFEPLPRAYFQKSGPLVRLCSPREKIERALALGTDAVGLLRFNRTLADMPAETFIDEVLVGRLNAREIWIGPDFRFGHGRRGDVGMLEQHAHRHGYQVSVLAVQSEGDERISSTRIRSALLGARFSEAERLLGRPYSISGRVIRGQQLGRTLGYPTANISLHGRVPPVHGIYAVRVTGAGLVDQPSVASIGNRPTVNGKELLLEVHLFDYQGDLYSQRLTVDFVSKIRDEVRFASLDDLVSRMHIDAREARVMLQSNPASTGSNT
ncbi:MAG: bifunctional riboflavin kinase/FAD synthetase [Ahniella sp.]|nr:bifunctional riboflavin kinase/FAD synthetase [Ahniella sp.]